MGDPTSRETTELRRFVEEHHDACVSCGYVFKEGDTTHHGYKSDGSPSYVCDRCAPSLSEVAAKRYFFSRPYLIPEPDAKLWRYMDFTKYVGLLSARSLYFSRADSFDDEFEGAKGLQKNRSAWDRHYAEFFRSAIRNPPKGYTCDLSDAEVEKEVERLLSQLEAGGEQSRRTTYVNCWHESIHESEAMWRLYSSFLPNAVAVRTTYSKLYQALSRDPSIRIGRVKYIDLKNEYSGVNDAFWRKRKSFEHEREVRALIHDSHHSDIGKLVPCDVALLIEEVFVSPKSPTWFLALVTDVSTKYGLTITVSRSELCEQPFF